MPPQCRSRSRIEFVNERPVFRRLVMRGAMLELVTVGFYRFWLATDMRRHLWSRTSVDGDAPEYVGTAKELLIGFLFALAILAPLYGGVFPARHRGRALARLRQRAARPVLLSLHPVRGVSGAALPAHPHGVARRPLLDGRLGHQLRCSASGFGRCLLRSRSALPGRGARAALERYKMRNTAYGSLQGQFAGTGGGLFKSIWWLWGC